MAIYGARHRRSSKPSPHIHARRQMACAWLSELPWCHTPAATPVAGRATYLDAALSFSPCHIPVTAILDVWYAHTTRDPCFIACGRPQGFKYVKEALDWTEDEVPEPTSEPITSA